MRTAYASAALAVALSLSEAPAAAQNAVADACVTLAVLTLPDLTSLEAAAVAPGPFDLPASRGTPATTTNLPAHCRVRGVVAPAIRFEVWLPEPSAWNGRFEAVGGGGFAGTISYGAMAGALQRGYVTASTDTGHVASDLEWLGDAGRLRDYGYRGINEMTSKAQAVIERYYDRSPDYSYFNGCSTGGRQGLMQAQRFPNDYDGIVAGAPVNHFVETHFTQLWVALAAKPVADDSILSAEDLALVNDAVLAQCDTIDGVEDGVIENPRVCNFDPAVLQCSGSQAAECLDESQVTALRKIYSGPVNSATGESLFPGLAPGGETTWSLVTAPGPAQIPNDYFVRSVFKDPNWDWRTFDFADDIARARETTGEVLDATNPDLSAFRDGGSKLILYHGWNDQVIFPQGTLDYYERVEAAITAKPSTTNPQTSDFFRLFMVPGMTHCRGGAGTDQFDAQAAIEAWVERGVAPNRIEASRRENGAVTRTRPLCPYPQTARYDGSGDTNDTSNFVCRL
jgi:feruloyl esterase